MKIDLLVLGAYQTNCYILRKDTNSKNCLIIDTGLEAYELIDFLSGYELKPAALVLTHGHADHIAGAAALCENYHDIKIYIHKLDAEMLTDAANNLSALVGEPFKTRTADILLEEGGIIEQAGIKLEVFHTPGHTQGGISLYSKADGVVFVGDTLFADSVGRTDFPGGNMMQLTESIKQKLLTLPEQTVCYPGHGPITTIAQEKAHNQFLQ